MKDKTEKLNNEISKMIISCENEIKKFKLENLKIAKTKIKMWLSMVAISIVAGLINSQDCKTAICSSVFTGVVLSNEILKHNDIHNFKAQKQFNNEEIRKNKKSIELIENCAITD